MTILFPIFTHAIAFAAGALAVVSVGLCMTAKDAGEAEATRDHQGPRVMPKIWDGLGHD